ncbi:MAG: nucleoside triphosphate pyrophosphohydrolase [Eubacteriaceae bacterium]|nr:nucleoside triphosphate pyrophosphohydrolase [Eubacteriaceae bacterium]
MKKITIAGLGPGELKSMTLETYGVIKSSKSIFLRTGMHPAADELEKEGIRFETFDYLYEESGSFEDVYSKIACKLVEEVRKCGQLVYAVPGHPLFAEKSVEILLELLDNIQDNVEVEILSALSFVDSMITSLRIDPVKGLQIMDALSIDRQKIDTNTGIMITQVYDRFVASNLKIALLDYYPEDKEVYLVHKSGIIGEETEKLKLFELDRSGLISYLTSLYIPPEVVKRPGDLNTLLGIMEHLRGEEGCPWDREQTFKSLRKYIVEEAYEVVDAIDKENTDEICEELGDLLLQVVFLSQIAKEEYLFDMSDVIEAISLKLINRHPHVFESEASREFSHAKWESIKREEKGYENISDQMDNIPRSFPVYLKAEKAQKKAGLVGFDWKDPLDAADKVVEELEELKEAIRDGAREEIIKESGDLVFSVINVLRLAKVDFEEALKLTIDKFISRFKKMENYARAEEINMDKVSLDKLNEYWEKSKNED